MNDILLEMKNISKSFPGVRALDVIAFVLRSMNEETRQTDEEAEAQMKRLIRILVLEGYVNEQE